MKQWKLVYLWLKQKNRLHIHHLRQAYTGLNQLLPPPYDIHTHLQSRFRIANQSTTVLHGGRSIWIFPPLNSVAAPNLPDAADASRALACAHHLLRSGWSETKHSTHSQHYEPDQQCFAHFFFADKTYFAFNMSFMFFMPPDRRWRHNFAGIQKVTILCLDYIIAKKVFWDCTFSKWELFF